MTTLTAVPSVENRPLESTSVPPCFTPTSYQAFRILHVGFVMAPIITGLDKFFNVLTDWEKYLSPIVTQVSGLSANQFMAGVGVIEILAGILGALKPRIGGFIVAVWMLGLTINLLSIPAYYDIALRDFGLCLGALALSRLAVEFEHHRVRRYT